MKKGFLFSIVAMLLSGFGFGGVSLADTCTETSVVKIGDECYETLQGAIDSTQEGNIIPMADDGYLEISQDVSLDLKGKKIIGGIFVYNGATVSITNGSIEGNYPIISYGENTELILSDFSVTATNGIYADKKGKLVLNDGVVINSVEFSVMAFGGSEIIINGGTYTNTDNFVVGTNGSDGEGENTITINGGIFNGGIFSPGYVACGIYVANSDTVTVNGGTFNITNGAGIVARGGTSVISNDVVFNVTGDPTVKGKVGDSRIVVPQATNIVMDLNSGYPGRNPIFKVIAPEAYLLYAGEEGYKVSIADGEEITQLTFTKSSDGDTLVINHPTTKEGYQWYDVTDADSPILYDSFGNTVEKSLVLKSIVNTYTVRFYSDGIEIEDPQTVIYGGTATEPDVDIPWKILLGWFNGDDKFNFETPVTSNLSLEAQWEDMISVGEAKIDDDTDEGTGMVVYAEAPAMPTAVATDVQSSNSTATVQGEVELNVYNDTDGSGSPDDPNNPISSKVNFTKAVLVRIPVASGTSVKIKVKHNGVGQTFGINGLATAGVDCNNGVASSNVYDGSTRPVNSGYVEIWTCSASTFVAYTEVTNPTPSSNTSGGGGGGGGSSSSYSCKSLPANAVVNNTSKPKKDTNYSYSTDTGVVCTFQCKAGYTRNEKDEKCEKSSEAPVGADKEGTEKVDTTDTSDTAFEDLRKVLDDGYNVEFHNAYNFAFKNGITTMPNIQAADMNSPLTRIAMAKMLSKYAINVLKKTPDTTKTISFPDVSAELDAEYNNGVTLAYQLGIMGVNIENFRPDDLVTRAEFVTALSRMLFGLADGENLYYETHMQKLLDENIITVDNPNMHELRGYVMIMLMRSVKNN